MVQDLRGSNVAYLEHKLLYSTAMLDRSKIVNEAPFTSYFGNKSPGRAAIYCAYNIVRAYMDAHPELRSAASWTTPTHKKSSRQPLQPVSSQEKRANPIANSLTTKHHIASCVK